jgi:hypothetical protein
MTMNRPIWLIMWNSKASIESLCGKTILELIYIGIKFMNYLIYGTCNLKYQIEEVPKSHTVYEPVDRNSMVVERPSVTISS